MTTLLQRAAQALLDSPAASYDQAFNGGICGCLWRLSQDEQRALRGAVQTALAASRPSCAFLPSMWSKNDEVYNFHLCHGGHESFDFLVDVRYIWRLQWLMHLAEGGTP